MKTYALKKRTAQAKLKAVWTNPHIASITSMMLNTTHFGAYEAPMKDKVGSIDVGKYADLVILEKNLFDLAPGEISKVKAMSTIMDGIITHQDGM